MQKKTVRSIVHAPILLIARLIRLVSINRVVFKTIGDREVVCKQRHRFSWLLIVPGNFVFRWRKVPVRVLHNSEWMHWERTIKPFDFSNDECLPNTLVLEKIEGVPLIEILIDTNRSSEQKLEAFSLAASSLNRFHQRTGGATPAATVVTQMSHGDATARNVMVDLESQAATWFDFDLQHDMKTEVTARQADDLRAFLFSTAHYFPEDHTGNLVRIAQNVFPRQEIWCELASQLTSRWFPLDLFHFAHTRPTVPRAQSASGAQGSSARMSRALVEEICRVCISPSV